MISKYTKNKVRNAQGGFTLIETLFAVLLLSVAIASPLTLAQRGLTATVVAKDQIIAFYLAQDALEWVRFARDSNRLAGGDWLLGGSYNLAACASDSGTDRCRVDSKENQVVACSDTSGCPRLRYVSTEDGTGYFTYDTPEGSTQTIFTRTVSIKEESEREATLTVEVAWQNVAGVTHPPVILRETLYDWQ